MHEFTKSAGLPERFKRWQCTVDAMLEGVETDSPIYLMVDQGVVRANSMHRRGGLHVDGYWNPGIQAHGQPYSPPGHHPRPPEPHRGHIHAGGHGHIFSGEEEALILAASALGCVGYNGEWQGEVGEGGDCEHIDRSKLCPVDMLAGKAYAGDVLMLHESIPITVDCLRTVVRLNVKGWSPKLS